MNPETMENLGFTEENLVKTEEERKKQLAERFISLNDEARKGVEKYFKEMYKETQDSKANDSNV